MLILTATNITGEGKLQRKDGTSDYKVWVGINQFRIWEGFLRGHVRKEGAAVLIRKIADEMDKCLKQNQYSNIARSAAVVEPKKSRAKLIRPSVKPEGSAKRLSGHGAVRRAALPATSTVKKSRNKK